MSNFIEEVRMKKPLQILKIGALAMAALLCVGSLTACGKKTDVSATRVVGTVDGEKIYCALLGDGEFEVMEAKHLYDGHYQHDQRDNSDVTKLTVKFKGVKSISVAIAPMEGGVAPAQLPEDKAIAEW